MPEPTDVGAIAGLRRVTVRTVVDSFDDHVPGLAAEMAFFVVLSLPPLLLAVLGSVGFVSTQESSPASPPTTPSGGSPLPWWFFCGCT